MVRQPRGLRAVCEISFHTQRYPYTVTVTQPKAGGAWGRVEWFRIGLLPDANRNFGSKCSSGVGSASAGPNVMRRSDRFRLPSVLSRGGRGFLSAMSRGSVTKDTDSCDVHHVYQGISMGVLGIVSSRSITRSQSPDSALTAGKRKKLRDFVANRWLAY